MLWTADQVIHWAVWVMKEFNIEEMEIGSIHIPGQDLCSFNQEEFLQKVPNGEILWSHLELLRKCKSVTGQRIPSEIIHLKHLVLITLEL